MHKFVFFLFFLTVFFNCNSPKNKQNLAYIELSGFAQGTTWKVIYNDSENINYQSEIDSLLISINKSMSIWDSMSLLSRINRNAPNVMIDNDLQNVLKSGLKIGEMTNGAFDITVLPLVDLWGFGLKKKDKVLKSQIDSVLPLVNYRNIALENGIIKKKNPKISIDVNGIAQGYSVDAIAMFLEIRNVQNYLVEVGGELRAKGVNRTGNLWNIGIDKPTDGSNEMTRDLELILQISDISISTSGNYRRYYIMDGVKYAHTINPRTGRPVTHNLLSATVITKDCAWADGLATAFMVMGVDKSIEFVKQHNDIEVLLIYTDNEGKYRNYMTDGVKKMIVP